MAVAPFNWDDAVQWDGPGAIAGSEEILSADRLDRARYAEFLTKYLAAEGKQRNYVLNLNAEWGAGKTWFIKRWYMELKAHYPTVYIDAWQQDFSDDPLLTVISSIIDQLRDATGNKVAIPDGIKSKLLGLLKVGGKLVLKSAIKRAGWENSDFSVEGEDADKLVDTLCSNHKESYESIQYLKQEIRQWVEGAVGLSEGELDYPAFILIDELDRCRPSYAVEMLETIKHIFDIPKVVFVLATDTEQLQHAVKVIYGSEFNAYTYLSRFFSRRFSLPSGSRLNFIEEYLARSSFLDRDVFEMIWPKGLNVGSLSVILSAIADSCHLSLRSTEKVIDRLLSIFASIQNDDINIAFLAYLIAVQESVPDDYEKIVRMKRSLQVLYEVKSSSLLLSGLYDLHGAVFIYLSEMGDVYFKAGLYEINIYQLIKGHLVGYLGEYESAIAQLNSEYLSVERAYSKASNEERSEKISYYVLNCHLHEKSRVPMEKYKDWIELAMSFD
ncbi:KAP family P-loop NTPase fold protein [Aeromonas veronii]|uniref:KAP family P-loop NTPase fold protein n=1 Tax=Aeromonas veronii TaxID=654 RepID=UPI003D24AA21